MNYQKNEHLKLDFKDWKCRCSAIAKIMAYPDRDELPVGAKTYIESEVDKMLYDFEIEINTKEMDKGTNGENESIEVHNGIHFTSYQKSLLSKSNEFLTTESCDIDDEKNNKIIDIKTSWSKKTFPKTKEKAREWSKKQGHHYQLQGYMTIYGRNNAQVSHNLIDTPEELCAWEDPSAHVMADLPMELRNTTVDYKLSINMEIQIENRIKLCRPYMQAYYKKILRDHGLIQITAK